MSSTISVRLVGSVSAMEHPLQQVNDRPDHPQQEQEPQHQTARLLASSNITPHRTQK